MMKNILLTFGMLFFALGLYAQSLEEELGFIYVKADYLLETNRYEEAISEFTKIIEQDPAYRDVLYKRASAKYALAAYAGVIKDLASSFELVGITPESLLLFGEAQESAGHKAAGTTMQTVALIYPDHRKTRKYQKKSEKRHDPQRQEEEPDDTENELKKLEDKISSILSDLMPDEEEPGEEQTHRSDDEEMTEDDMEDGNIKDEAPSVEVYVPDNSVNEIYIDEDLTLEIKNGLGNRRVLEQPNILILSESSGDVAVDICVNRNGKVTSAEFNAGSSTLNTQSLISLAVRKSNEFWFDGANRDETCGTIIFRITGRS